MIVAGVLVALVVVGVLVLAKGVRGRRFGSHPHCPNCGRDWYGVVDMTACSECGQPAVNPVFGTHARRPRLILAGGSIVGVAGTMLLVGGVAWVADFDLYRRLPTATLLARAATDEAALDELAQRRRDGALTPEQREEISASLLRLRLAPDAVRWQQQELWLAGEASAGQLPAEDVAAVHAADLAGALLIRPLVVAGEGVPFAVDPPDHALPWLGPIGPLDFEIVAPDGSVHDVPGVRANWGSRTVKPYPTPTFWTVPANASPGGFAVRLADDVAANEIATFRVGASGADTVDVAEDEARRATLEAELLIEHSRQTNSRGRFGSGPAHVWRHGIAIAEIGGAGQPPIWSFKLRLSIGVLPPAAYDVYAVREGRRVFVGRVASDWKPSPHFAPLLGSDAPVDPPPPEWRGGTADLLLEPNPVFAAETPHLTTILGGVIRLRDVPLLRLRRDADGSDRLVG